MSVSLSIRAAIRGLSFLPQVEMLEDRTCPACITLKAGASVLILGDATDNVVQVTDDGATLSVTCDAQNTSFTGVNRLVVQTLAGNDGFTYQQTQNVPLVSSFQIDLGTGND